MSEELQLRRGTASEVAAFTGAQGEVVVDITNNRLVLQDGSTMGGFPVAKLAETAQVSNFLNNRGGFTNLLLNGAFEVSQVAGPFIITSLAYTVDGWMTAATGASVTVSQVAGLDITSSSLQIVGQSGVTAVNLSQRIESNISVRMNGQIATFQIEIDNQTGTTFTPQLSGYYPSAKDNWTTSTIDPNLSAVSLQPCPNGVKTLVAYTFTPTNPNLGYEIVLLFGGNLNGTGYTVVVADADLRASPSTTLGLNNSPPTPELRPISIEDYLCRRYYYQELYTNANTLVFGAYNAASQLNAVFFGLSVRMFKTPTVSYSGSWANTNASAPTITALSHQTISFGWETTALGWSSIGNPAGGGFIANSRL